MTTDLNSSVAVSEAVVGVEANRTISTDPSSPPEPLHSPQDEATSAPSRTQFTIPGYDTAMVVEAYRQLYYPEDRINLEPIVSSLRAAASQHCPRVGEQERLCVEIMRYTTSSMALGSPERLECASATLRKAVGSCGTYAMVMCELARVAGMPARFIGLFGIPSIGSHALAEIYHDGAWHLYDPTFGVFFYSRPKWDGTGHVLSAQDIIVSRQRPDMIQVVEKPWQLDYDRQRSFMVQPLLDPPNSHVLTYWSEKGRRTIFPVAFGNDAVISVPLEVDLSSQRDFSLGAATGQWLDTWLQCIDDPRNGYFVLGGTCPTIHQFVRIKARAPSRIKIEYVATPESWGRLSLFPLAGCLLLSSRVDGLTTTIYLYANSESPAFLLMTDGACWIDTLRYAIDPETGEGPSEPR